MHIVFLSTHFRSILQVCGHSHIMMASGYIHILMRDKITDTHVFSLLFLALTVLTFAAGVWVHPHTQMKACDHTHTHGSSHAATSTRSSDLILYNATTHSCLGPDPEHECVVALNCTINSNRPFQSAVR